MSSKTSIGCATCKQAFKYQDIIYGSSCGHLYHIFCWNAANANKTNCPECGFPKPFLFKMFIEFCEIPLNQEEQTKIIQLHSELEENKRTIALLEEKYNYSQNLIQKLEGKLKKLDDCLAGRKAIVSDLEDKLTTLEMLNVFLNKEMDIMKSNREDVTSITDRNCENSKSCTDEHKNKIHASVVNSNGKKEFVKQNSSDVLPELISLNSNTFSNIYKNIANANSDILQHDEKVYICNYSLKDLEKYDPDECVVYLARKMKISLSRSDIRHVIALKGGADATLIVEFNNNRYKNQFLKNKFYLKKCPNTKFLSIEQFSFK